MSNQFICARPVQTGDKDLQDLLAWERYGQGGRKCGHRLALSIYGLQSHPTPIPFLEVLYCPEKNALILIRYT